MFGEIAPRYDLLNHLLSLNADRYWRWRAVRLAPPQGEAPILDACTGTGDMAFAYDRWCRGKALIVATDFCPEMVALGAAKRDRYGGSRAIRFAQADTHNLPFDDNCFQLVTVAFGLRNLADADAGLREMVRVCRPQGRVAVLEFSLPRRQPWKAVYGWYFGRLLPRIGQWVARNRQKAYYYLPESVRGFPEGEALLDRLRAAGLESLRAHPLTFGIATLYVGTKPL